MTTNPEVDAWFAENKPRAEAELRRVREIIPGADPRLTEYVKYGTVCFGYEGDMVTFVQFVQYWKKELGSCSG